MALILVGSLVGIGVQSFASRREASSKPVKVSEPAKKSNKATENVEVTVNFKKKVRLDANGTAKVKFLISPKTKVVIRGHKSGEVFETFKASSGNAVVTKQMTFDTPGTYDITATRGKKKVVKHLKVEEYTESSSSESSSSSSSSQSSSSSSHSTSSSSSHSSSSSNTGNSNGGNDTANSNTKEVLAVAVAVIGSQIMAVAMAAVHVQTPFRASLVTVVMLFQINQNSV